MITKYLVDDVRDTDLVGLRIRNSENVQYKMLGIIIRSRDQLKPVVSSASWVKSFGAIRYSA